MLRIRLAFSFALMTFSARSQDTVQFAVADDRGLVNYSQNIIRNPEGLNLFFQKLLKLKIEKKGQINILHIGDSHVQADYLTNQVRQNFQREFGNAGRGLLVPGRVAQTNEPNNYVSQSDNTWESKRIVFPDQALPTGLSGVAIRSSEDGAALKFSVKDYPDLKYGFNKVTAFYLQEPRSFHVAVTDSTQKDLGYFGNFSTSPTKHMATISLPYSTNSISLRAFKSLPNQDRVTFFGFNFSTSNTGILYHAIGANGAKYKHYLANDYFVEQTSALSPDLIIIALGTNESLDHPYFDPAFPTQVDEFIQKLKRQNPSASMLISIHPDGFKRKNKKNPGVANVRKYLLTYAAENKIAYYDLYEASGGNHSAEKWRAAELLREDGVHFTRPGYELQGNMFYDALMNAYNDYVSNGH